MKQVTIGLLVVAIVGGIVYFLNNKNGTGSSVQPEPSKVMSISSPPGVPPETTDMNVKVIDVEAGSFYYKPEVIDVAKGQKIKIIMKSVSMMHDFNIDELGVKMPIIKNGDTGTVEFTADKVGTFEYYCSVGKHRANGQVGKITVR